MVFTPQAYKPARKEEGIVEWLVLYYKRRKSNESKNSGNQL